MASKALKREQAADAPVVSIMKARAFEQMLAAAGFKRLPQSRLGASVQGLHVWIGRRYYVILTGERVIVGQPDSWQGRLRTTLRQLDCSILHRLREDGSDREAAG